jgi:hypothetical protein
LRIELIELRVAGYGDCYSYDEFVAYYGIDADDYWGAAQILPQSDWRRVMQRAPDDCCLTNPAEEDEAARAAEIKSARIAAFQQIAMEVKASRVTAEEAELARIVAAKEAELARIVAAEEAELARIVAAEEAELVRIVAAEEAELVRIVAAEEAELPCIVATEEAELALVAAGEADVARIVAKEAALALIATEEAELSRIVAKEVAFDSVGEDAELIQEALVLLGGAFDVAIHAKLQLHQLITMECTCTTYVVDLDRTDSGKCFEEV